MPVLTGRAAAAAAVASVLVLLLPLEPPWSLLLVNGLLLVVVLGDAWRAPSPAAVTVARELPAVLALGGEGELTWRVGNPVARPLRVRLADGLAPSLGAGTRRVAMTLPASGRRSARTTLRPQRRGRFSPDELTVRTIGPLGLAGRQGTRSLPSVLRVYPPFRSRDEAELRLHRARILEVGLRSAKGRGGGTEFEQLREYTEGDEFRRIDWSATARAGKAIVRTYRAERNQSILLLLDTGRTMAGRVAGVPRVEHAMDAVMMVTTVAAHLGDRVGLIAFDRAVRAMVRPGQGRDQLGRVTEAMYDLEPALASSDYAGAFAQALARFRRRNLLVLFTDLNEDLLPTLSTVAGDHLVMVASVRDPAVQAWSTARPDDAEGAYRKAAAIAALAERRRLAAQLTGRGVTVIDEEPGLLAPALADAYLRIKATGRL